MTTPTLMSKTSATESVYRELANYLGHFDDIIVEEKKTSLHITRGGAAFLGVHPRKEGLRLNIVLAQALAGDRIAKSEAVSRNRFHNEIDLKSPSDFDEEVQGWIREAYELKG